MIRHKLWARLAWKEVREDWIVVLACAVSPVLLCGLGSRWGSEGTQLFNSIAWLIVQTLVVLWAAQKGGRARQGQDLLETRLPVNPVEHWVLNFTLPLAAAAGLGMLFGMGTAGVGYSPSAGYSTAAVMAIDTAVTFALCYLLSASISYWGAIVVGIGRLTFAGLIDPGSMSAAPPADAVRFALTTVLALASGCFAFAVISRAKPLQARQAYALLVVVGVAYLPYAAAVYRNHSAWIAVIKRDFRVHNIWNSLSGTDDGNRYSTPIEGYTGSETDWSYSLIRVRHARGDVERVELGDHRGHVGASKQLRGSLGVIGSSGYQRIYVGRQLPKSKMVEVLVWRPETDGIETIGKFHLGTNALTRFEIGQVSPDEAYALMRNESKVGKGTDIWVLDMRRNRAFLVMDNSDIVYDKAIWDDRQAVLSGMGGLAVIDLDAMKARTAGWSGRWKR